MQNLLIFLIIVFALLFVCCAFLLIMTRVSTRGFVDFKVEYQLKGSIYVRTSVVSAKDQAMVLRVLRERRPEWNVLRVYEVPDKVDI